MTPTKKTHSRIGIAACVAGVGMFVSFLVGCLVFFGSGSDSGERWYSSQALNLLPMMVVLFLPIPVHILGLVMGVVSLFFPKREILFPIIAIILNALFGVCSLIPWVWIGLKTGGVK